MGSNLKDHPLQNKQKRILSGDTRISEVKVCGVDSSVVAKVNEAVLLRARGAEVDLVVDVVLVDGAPGLELDSSGLYVQEVDVRSRGVRTCVRDGRGAHRKALR